MQDIRKLEADIEASRKELEALQLTQKQQQQQDEQLTPIEKQKINSLLEKDLKELEEKITQRHEEEKQTQLNEEIHKLHTRMSIDSNTYSPRYQRYGRDNYAVSQWKPKN